MKELLVTSSGSHAFGICLELAEKGIYSEFHEIIDKNGRKKYVITVEEQTGGYPGLRSVIW